MATSYQQPGPIELPLTPEYDEEVGLGGFHIESCDLSGLEEGKELIAPFDQVEIAFDYPLRKAFLFRFERRGGFTREGLVQIVCETYQKIYSAEKQRLKTVDGLVNAPENAPPFGIFGHALEDLILEGIEHLGSGKYRIEVGS